MITPWLIGCDEVEGGLFWEILIEILPIWVNLIDPEPEAHREHYGMQMGRFVCVFSSWVVALSTEVRNINVLWPFFRSSVSITGYAVWPQPLGRLLAHLPDVRPITWRRGAVSPESANFPFSLSSMLPSGDWKSHFSSSVATVTIFCDFCYCYPAPCPREARVPLALRRLLSGSYFCESVVSLEPCSKCVGSVLRFSFSFNFL